MVTEKEISEIIQLHNKMQNSYFWIAPRPESSRRWLEQNGSLLVEGYFNNKKISLQCETVCTYRNVFYKGKFFIDGKKVTIREVKKLLQPKE